MFPPPTEKGKIEIKHYPAYRSGTYTYNGQLSQAANAAFEPLYRHISSNNIPMTAPVETRYPIITLQEGPSGKSDEVGQAEVSFLYRDQDVHPQNIAQGIQERRSSSNDSGEYWSSRCLHFYKLSTEQASACANARDNILTIQFLVHLVVFSTIRRLRQMRSNLVKSKFQSSEQGKCI